ncbi:uncharacterized membrane protein YheB (UPF0754 family) [Desulfofundulus luciae]|uniref:Uncharacterized membrane protein YheB (UPF0754 family) n=1 Tax=Desulfofundulus luciae TaxID=74702 RepID=A0ABU0B3Z3_9FIRM|nr:DUF445 family protein [Desulfofundulus luciae]MDQ0287444.1 uncharacterized membrane protein YheB (UPF0754 family) [Desulfofundulus luciae]
MHWTQAVLLPVVGALIGWLTNWLAVRLIFRPYKPVRVLGYTIQGVVPKRRGELARVIGRVIEEQLLPKERLLNYLRSEQLNEDLVSSVNTAVRARVMDRLPGFLPLSLRRMISDALAEQIRRELPPLVNELVDRFGEKLKVELCLSRVVEEQVNSFSLDQLEQIITTVSSRELRHIEILGGVLGFIIGLLQAGVFLLPGKLL